MTPEELIALRRVAAVAASPDGTWLAVAAQRIDEDTQKYVSDLWRVPLDGGDAIALTSGKHNDTSPAFRHDGALLFLSNRPTPKDDEGKRSQVWLFRPAGGDPVPLTDEPLGVEAFDVAKRADVLAIKTSRLPGVEDDKQRETAKDRADKGSSAIRYTEMPVRHWDHWLPDSDTQIAIYAGSERRGALGDSTWQVVEFAISADGNTLGITRDGKQGDDRLTDTIAELWNTESLELTAARTMPKVWLGLPVFGDSAVFLEQTTRNGERAPWTEVVRWQTDDDSWEVVIDDFEAMALVDVTADGHLLAVGEHEGTTPVWLFDAATGERTRITAQASGGTHAGVSPFDKDGEAYVCGIRSGLMQAPEPFIAPLAADTEPQIVANISGWAPPSRVSVEEARATSTDGESVHYYLVGADDNKSRPTLLWIHGGPMAAWGDVWHWRWNSLVPIARGYRVVLPNPRGSTGYGYDFRNGIWGNVWGAQCFDDLMAVTDQLETRSDVDAGKLVAMGGSFGGYMTNWIGGMTDRFACLVVHAGVASYETFHGITDNPAWWAEMFGMDPFVNHDELRLYSPISNVRNWKSPTLIIHGDKDYRVPVGEALVLFEALQKYGVESELLVYPDENHWILQPRNIVSWYDEFLGFTDRQTSHNPRIRGARDL